MTRDLLEPLVRGEPRANGEGANLVVRQRPHPRLRRGQQASGRGVVARWHAPRRQDHRKARLRAALHEPGEHQQRQRIAPLHVIEEQHEWCFTEHRVHQVDPRVIDGVLTTARLVRLQRLLVRVHRPHLSHQRQRVRCGSNRAGRIQQPRQHVRKQRERAIRKGRPRAPGHHRPPGHP